METPRSSNEAFPIIALIVTIVAVGILAFLAVPQVTDHGGDGRGAQALNNAKQIHLATVRMVLDSSVAPDPKLGWTGDLPDITDVGEFGERLVDYKYFER